MTVSIHQTITRRSDAIIHVAKSSSYWRYRKCKSYSCYNEVESETNLQCPGDHHRLSVLLVGRFHFNTHRFQVQNALFRRLNWIIRILPKKV